jgi:hypothetical protein
MISLGKSFGSYFVKAKTEENGFPVVKTDTAIQLGFDTVSNALDEDEAIEKVKSRTLIKPMYPV